MTPNRAESISIWVGGFDDGEHRTLGILEEGEAADVFDIHSRNQDLAAQANGLGHGTVAVRYWSVGRA